MNKIIESMLNLKELEQFAGRKIAINRMNPVIKIVITFLFIIWVASVHKYDLEQVILLMVYPVLMLVYLDIPFKCVGSKLLLPILFSVGFAIGNPFFDREILVTIGSINVSGGMISFVTIILKAMFTFTATLILVMTTPIDQLGMGFKKMGVPNVMVVLILITYRYIEVLTSEVFYTLQAYQLRALKGRGIHVSSWGPFVGHIIIKSYKRARDIYHAMELRGFGTS